MAYTADYFLNVKTSKINTKNKSQIKMHNNTDQSASSVDEDHTPDAAREVQQFAQGLLKGLRFRGTFVEKRYVPVIKMYRSVISVSSEERPLIRILKEVTKRINKLIGEDNPFFWIGFTQNNDDYFLWVNLTEEILGEYLFNIRGFEIDQTEAKVRLRQVRTKEAIPQPDITFSSIGSNFMDETVKPIVKDFANDLGINLRSTLTFSNMKEASSFLIITILTILSGAFYSAKYLLEFSLRLTREFSFVMKNLTPTILSFIDLLKYVTFGFYWVILALFGSSYKVANNQETYNQQGRIQYYNNGYTNRPNPTGRRPITYHNPNLNGRHYQGVKITELHD